MLGRVKHDERLCKSACRLAPRSASVRDCYALCWGSDMPQTLIDIGCQRASTASMPQAALSVLQSQQPLLPGVRHNCDGAQPVTQTPALVVQVRRTRKQLYEHIDGDYYGYRDEEDGILIKVEAEAEATMRQEVTIADARRALACSRVYAEALQWQPSAMLQNPSSWYFQGLAGFWKTRRCSAGADVTRSELRGCCRLWMSGRRGKRSDRTHTRA